jgi:CUB domain./Regulator of chromosome condensation (RCC1) repeat.
MEITIKSLIRLLFSLSFLTATACQLDAVLEALQSQTEEFAIVQDDGTITDLNKTNYHVSGRCPVASSTIQFSNSPSTLTCNGGVFDGYIDLSNATEGMNAVTVTANGTTIATVDWNVLMDTQPPVVLVGNPVTSYTGFYKSLAIPVSFSDTAFINWTSSDITISGTGVNNCSVALSGSGLTNRTITLSNCDQPTGTLTVSVDAGIARDANGNLSLASNSSASITIDNVAPTIAENMTGATAGNSSTSFTWELNFTGADLVSATASDIALTGATAGCTKSISGTGSSQRILTVTGCTGNGTLNLQVPAGAATDLANNPSAALTLTSVTIDNQGPTLTLGAPTPTVGNSGTTFSWVATYSGATAITLANTDVVLSGATTNCAVSISGSGSTTRTIQVSGCTDTGNVQIQVNSGTATDAAGNLASGSAISTAVTVNNGTVGISLSAATPSSINAVGSATYTITYTNAVNYLLAASDISLSGTTAGCTKALTGSGPTFTVTIANCSGNGNVQISVAANSANDGAGNNAPAAGPSANLNIDNTKPTIAVVGPTPTIGNAATEFVWTLNFTGADSVNLPLSNIVLSGMSGNCVATISGTGLSQREVHVTGCTATGSMTPELLAGVLSDAAGNTSDIQSTGAVTLDNVKPTVAIGNPSPTTGNSSTTFVWPVTYTGASSVTLADTDVALTTSLTGCTVSVSGTGTTNRNVSVTNCSGEGTLKITINAGTASDAAGNTTAASAISTQVVVDNTAPTIAFNTPAPTNGNSGTTFVWVLDFTGADVVTMANSDIYFNGATSGCAATVSGTGIAHRTVSVTGCTGTGTLAIYIKAGAISDNAGNGNALTTTSPTVNVSNGAPVIAVSGLLVGNTTANSMTSIASGASLINYVYKIGATSSTDCSVTTGYSSAQTLGSLTHDLTAFGSVPMTACFKGQDTFGTWSNIIDHRWSRTMSAAFSGRTNICGSPATLTSTLSTTNAQGVLTDSGGESADYLLDNEVCTYTIDTGSTIVLKIESFNTEANWDFLWIYDGTTSGTQLAKISGTTFASSYTATSGKMTLKWTSDTSNRAPGFVASWGGVSLTGDDQDPNDFTFANVLNGTPNTVYTSSATITGISGTSVIAGIDGFDSQIRNTTQNTSWGSWTPVANGDTLSVRMTSGATTSDNRTANIQVGRTQKSWKLYWDNTAPTGSIQINGGAATSTTTAATLTLAATDPEGSPLQMYITQDAGCVNGGNWETFATSKPWTLLNEGVSNTVYVKYKDEAGNTSTCYSASIIQDNGVAPTAVLTSTNGTDVGTMNVNLTITFNENVTGLSASDFTMVNATIGSLSGSGKVYTATVTATTQGVFSATLPAGTVQDLQSNANTAASNTFTWTYDMVPPVLRVYNYYPVVPKYFDLYVECDDQSIAAIPTSALTLSNATAVYQSYSDVGTKRVFKYNLTPTGSAGSIMTAKINAGKISDAAGNSNAATNTESIVYQPQAVVSFTEPRSIFANASATRTVALTVVAVPFDVTVKVIRSGNLSTSAIGVVDNIPAVSTITIPANATSASLNIPTLANAGVGHQRIQLALTSDDSRVRFEGQDTHTILIKDSTMLATTPLGQIADNGGITTLNASGKLFGIGRGYFGTGNDFTGMNLAVTAIDAATTYKSVVGTEGAACGITSADEMRCWGLWATSNTGAQPFPPATYDSGTTYKQVAPSDYNTCGITTGNKLRCRGSNTYGILLTGDTSFQASFIDVDAGNSYKYVAVSNRQICVIDMSDRLYCWGQNNYGAVGNNTTTPVSSPALIDSGVTYAKAYSYGDVTCGITTAGVLKCWGVNWSGQLGTGDYSAHSTPTVVDSGTAYSKIVLSDAGRCGLTTTNQVKCWGNITLSQSPSTIATTYMTTPALALGGAQVQDIFGSGRGLCIRDSDNITSCTNGLDQNIQLSTWKTYEPLANWSKWIPDSSYGCGLTTTGVVKCTTMNNTGLGDGTLDTPNRTVSVPVFSNETYVDFDNDNAVCGITSTGLLRCWGNTYTFRWINMTDGNIYMPSRVTNAPTGLKKIAMGSGNICVIDSNDDVQCVGTATNLLGNSAATGAPTYEFSSFVKAATTKKFTQISMASNIVCGISTAQELLCWGTNPGDGSSASTDPVVVDPGTTYQSITVAPYTRCGLTTAGVVKCWGFDRGGLGTASPTNNYMNSPVVGDSGTTYKKLVTFKNSQVTCGITSADQLRCFGYGQTNIATTPTTYDSGTTYSEIYGGGSLICAQTTGGVLKCLAGQQSSEGFYSTLGTGKTVRGFAPLQSTHQ